ncbi:magnesium transporter CorA family protein [Candidatus Gottesmanbacteria bacterium]|nr:magnesium transporter CorA family protein [Candidatus Gottesmanbacteria bacterium]
MNLPLPQVSLHPFLTAVTNPFSRARDFLHLPGTPEKPKVDKNRMKIIPYDQGKLIVIWFPTPKNVSYLKRHYSFHPTHLDDVISLIQRPKIDFDPDYIFFVLHFPEYNEESKKIESKEVDFFLTKNDVIMISNHDFPSFDNLIDTITKKRKNKQTYFSQGPGFLLYRSIDKLVDTIFPLVEQVEKALEVIDTDVFTKKPRIVAKQISFLRRNVTYFQTIMKPQVNSFMYLLETRHTLVDKELRTYFTNISDHMRKIWDRIEDVNELSDNLSRTFESYLSFKTNETIKVLTIFSATLLPLTFITNIYGMNLYFLPFAQHPDALFLIGSIMFAIAASMLAVFRWRGWI